MKCDPYPLNLNQTKEWALLGDYDLSLWKGADDDSAAVGPDSDMIQAVLSSWSDPFLRKRSTSDGALLVSSVWFIVKSHFLTFAGIKSDGAESGGVHFRSKS